MSRRFVLFLLVFALCASSSMVMAQQPSQVVVFADQDLYTKGDVVKFYGVALGPEFPRQLTYTFQVERQQNVSTIVDPGQLYPQSVFDSGAGLEWVHVETHRSPYRPATSAFNDLVPFLEVLISRTNESWQPGLYRVSVQPDIGMFASQTIYFRVDSRTSTPVPEVKLLGQDPISLKVHLDRQVYGWTALAFTSTGQVVVQQLAFYGPSTEMNFLFNGAYSGLVSLVLFDGQAGSDTAGATGTFRLR